LHGSPQAQSRLNNSSTLKTQSKMNATNTNEQKHTPGPWTFEGAEIYGDTRYVARVYDWHNPNCDPRYHDINGALKAEGEANARLIAAAPELLEACQLYVRARNDGGMSMADLSGLADQAIYAAIAKATGGNP
jgi:hypothetical protein